MVLRCVFADVFNIKKAPLKDAFRWSVNQLISLSLGYLVIWLLGTLHAFLPSEGVGLAVALDEEYAVTEEFMGYG